jgi:hypothetical protein
VSHDGAISLLYEARIQVGAALLICLLGSRVEPVSQPKRLASCSSSMVTE